MMVEPTRTEQVIELVREGDETPRSNPFQVWKVGDPDANKLTPLEEANKRDKTRIRSVADNIPSILAQDRDPWTRQPGEGQAAYAAFCYYKDLDPLERSVKKAAEVAGKARTGFARWSHRWHWAERAELWDDSNRRIVDNQHQAEIKKTLADHTKASKALLGQALRVLQVEQGKKEPNGRAIQQAASAIDRAIHHNRLALGLPNDIRNQDVEMREQIRESLKLQDKIRVIIDEVICPDCQARVGAEIRLLATHQRRLAQRVEGVGG